MSAIAVLAWFLTGNMGCTGFLSAMVIAFWVSGFRQLPFEGFFEKLGEASLESYLFNIFMLAFMRDVFGWPGIFNYLMVSAVAIIGVFLAHRLLKGLLRSLSAGHSAAGTID